MYPLCCKEGGYPLGWEIFTKVTKSSGPVMTGPPPFCKGGNVSPLRKGDEEGFVKKSKIKKRTSIRGP